MPENPPPEHCPALAALALYSGSRTALIGYDCIPAISPELIHPGLPDRFMRYLEAVKHAHRVAGISGAAAREFEGFVEMLAAQGLAGPAVVECVLPVEMPPGEPVRLDRGTAGRLHRQLRAAEEPAGRARGRRAALAGGPGLPAGVHRRQRSWPPSSTR